MRKLLIAAALIVAAAGLSIAPRAEAMPLNSPIGTANQLNIVEQVRLCFVINGWNGPGMYQCGYEHRRGEGWHGKREEHREIRCERGFFVHEGHCVRERH